MPPDLRQKKVLIVDDEEKFCALLKAHIEEQIGCEVIVALSGEEAIELVKLQHPDLVLLDIRMAGMGGLVALKCLKDMAPAMPVVMVSVAWDEEKARYCFQAGASDYLTKPVDFERLDQALLSKLWS